MTDDLRAAIVAAIARTANVDTDRVYIEDVVFPDTIFIIVSIFDAVKESDKVRSLQKAVRTDVLSIFEGDSTFNGLEIVDRVGSPTAHTLSLFHRAYCSAQIIPSSRGEGFPHAIRFPNPQNICGPDPWTDVSVREHRDRDCRDT